MPLRFFVHSFAANHFGQSGNATLLCSLRSGAIPLPGCALHSTIARAFPSAIDQFVC